jgi:hypothetical protein
MPKSAEHKLQDINLAAENREPSTVSENIQQVNPSVDARLDEAKTAEVQARIRSKKEADLKRANAIAKGNDEEYEQEQRVAKKAGKNPLKSDFEPVKKPSAEKKAAAIEKEKSLLERMNESIEAEREVGRPVKEKKPRARKSTPPPAPAKTWSPSEEEKAFAAHPVIEQPRVESKDNGYGLRDKVSRGLSYLWRRGEDTYNVHVKGEQSVYELGEEELGRFGKAAAIGGGILSSAMSMGGVQIGLDLPRFLSQRHYSSFEREALKKSLGEARAASRERSTETEKSDFDKKRMALLQRIESSRYLSPQKRKKLLEKADDILARHTERTHVAVDVFHKEVAQVLDEAIETRVTSSKVAKESLNTVFAATGLHFLRAPSYAMLSLAESYQKAVREQGEGVRAKDVIRNHVIEGFRDWTADVRGREGDTNTQRFLKRTRALTTVLRGAGILSTLAMPVEMLADTSHFHESVSKAIEGYSHEVAERFHLAAPVALAETHTHTAHLAPALETNVEVPHSEMSAVELPPHFEDAVVREGDGISAALVRTIKHNPEKFGYTGNGNDELLLDRFSTRLAGKMVTADGLRHMWLKDDAVDHLAILPVERNGSWHVSFVDKETNEVLDDEQYLSYLTKEPRA